MTDHADTIDEMRQIAASNAMAALRLQDERDALLAENQRLETERDMLRRSLEGEMAENQRLREALEQIQEEGALLRSRSFIIAREALAGDAE